ncbi:MAG TPA: TonB system transport protein ExbD [Dongiaceae bacterium]|nr:TonB system transport protein ExbD [Dongiaceae bacterium]
MALFQRHAEEDLGEHHEINVTPFIDVILVLLIIFMVGAPLATVDMAVDLPTSDAKPSPRPDKPVFLTIRADKAITLDSKPVTLAGLGKALDNQFHGDKEQRIYLQADKVVEYGELMSVMNILRNAGYLKVALVGLEGRAEGQTAQ